jgi:PAS domain S-box-containing protein
MLVNPEILIVDDDESVCDILEQFLNREGYQTASVNKGEDAVKMLSQNRFDIILLDLVMPGMDGYEVMDYIKRNGIETVIIVITGHASKHSVVESLRKGVYDFLDKPFDLEKLSAIIGNALNWRRGELEKQLAKEALEQAYTEMENEVQRRTAELTLRNRDLSREMENRSLVEKKLKRSQEKYKSLTDNLNVGVYRNTAGSKGRFIEANPAIVKMFGYATREEFCKVNVSDLYQDPAERAVFSDKLAREGFVKNAELRLKRKDNSLFIGAVSAVAVKDVDGDIQYYDGTIEDVTERKQADKVLIRNEEWYRTLTQIGLSLSAEKDTKALLEMIVIEARKLTNADAGTLYLLDKERQELTFEIIQNDSMNTKMGGTSGIDIDLPHVPLFVNGKPNYKNVSSNVSLTGKTINIADVYSDEGAAFPGPREYDLISGYHTKSMFVMPLKNHENEIIGALQLINAQDPESGEIIPFSNEYEELVASLASQAGVALTNAQLIEDLNSLFYAFIRSIATAIDEKSPYTGGHINRVVQLSIMLAEKVNTAQEGPFKDVQLNEEEMEELRLAAWMHDVGKVTTPEYVVNKASKLETIFNRIDLIETRFSLIAAEKVNRNLKKKIDLLKAKKTRMPELEKLDHELADDLENLHRDLAFIKSCNDSDNPVTEDRLQQLKEIAAKSYSVGNEQHYYLTDNEIENLSIRFGNLTDEERKIIENHATMTMRILKQLAFPGKLEMVPEYAAGHHEKLDGSGYPQGLSEKDLPLQTRILALVDIFEALTARDRPYRQPMKLSEAIKIIGFMKAKHQIDADLYDLLIDSGIFYEYALKEMNPKQIDMEKP